jgi:eukaryotic-like serine/threonine-protein kinase
MAGKPDLNMISNSESTRGDEPETPRLLGGYAIMREVGRGGMGTVFEARHPRLAKRVALKAMKRSLAGDPVAEERFVREAQAIARIAHPHVVEVFDIGIEDGRPFIVMELLEGETLEALLAREGRLGAARMVDLLLPVVSAVAAIHDRGVVHRDLKPANVMLARRGRFAVEPVVFDFGISRMDAGEGQRDDGGGGTGARAPTGLTDPDLLVGTLPYLSPEQIRDARAAGPLSDQYALAVMVYECIAGRGPFGGGDRAAGGASGAPAANRYEQMHAVMTAVVTPPTAFAPELPSELDEVILRAMSRSPEARYPSVRAFGSALLSFAGGRATWRRWAVELAGADPRAADGETLTDVRSPDPAAPPDAPLDLARERPRRGGARARAAAAGVLALVTTGAVALGLRLAPGPRPSALTQPPAPAREAPVVPAPAGAIAPSGAPMPEPAMPVTPTLIPAAAARSAFVRQRPRSRARQPEPELRGRRATDIRSPAASANMEEIGRDEAINPYVPLR